MDCRTASLLIEAYHDDELELVEAARLLAHLEECGGCRARCDEAGRLREAVRAGRPEDRCPDELARRLAAKCSEGRGRPRRAWRVPAFVVVTGGAGLLAGWVVARVVPLPGVPGFRGFVAARPRTFAADVFCLRCALRAIFPAEKAADAGPHRACLRTADGRIWVVNPGSVVHVRPAEGAQAPRHVVVTAALDETTGLADVSAVSDAGEEPAARPAAH